jgi:hypothetical protein
MQLPTDGSSDQALHVRAARALQAIGAPMSAENLNAMMDRMANAQPSVDEGVTQNSQDELLATLMERTDAAPKQAAAPTRSTRAATPAAQPVTEQPVATNAAPVPQAANSAATQGMSAAQIAALAAAGGAGVYAGGAVADKLAPSRTGAAVTKQDPTLDAIDKYIAQTDLRGPTEDPIEALVAKAAAAGKDVNVEKPDPVAEVAMSKAAANTTVKQSATDPNGEKPRVRIPAGSAPTDAEGAKKVKDAMSKQKAADLAKKARNFVR